MNALARPLGFTVALILTFTSVTYVLPQMKGEAPVEREVSAGALTMESFVALGEEVFHGKGTCTLCHNKLGRAPDLLTYDVGKVATERLSDSRYRGKATSAEGYLRESMQQPSAYVVKGFGKKGTDDTESPMPAVDQPPIQLSEVEIGAVAAYLQAKDGNPVTVALPTAAPAAQKPGDAAQANPSPPKTAEEVIAKYGCGACHSVLKSQATVGPNLNDVGKRLKIDQIRKSIIDPKAEVAKGYPPIMPDFPGMTIGELALVAEFLATQTGSQR